MQRLTKHEARKAACKYNFEVVIVGDPSKPHAICTI